MKRTYIPLAAVLGLLLIVSSVVFVTAQDIQKLSPLPTSGSYQPDSEEQALNSVYQSVAPSVVQVNVRVDGGGNFFDRGAGTGSGFVIDMNGHIVTNNHVVEEAEFLQIHFSDGTIVEAELIGRDPDSDLAVVKVNPAQVPGLQPVQFADSNEVIVGQKVMAIGSPFGQDFTLTTGIVSALDRSLSAESNFSIPQVIQTDAAINPGNSGGPLLDMSGRVIGVNTAILSRSQSASGVGFAVPSNQVRRVVPYLIENGEYAHSWLGIAGVTLQPAQKEEMGLANDLQGVMVASVASDGPSQEAGLQGTNQAVDTPFGQLPVNGDIITAINGVPTPQMSDLISYLATDTLPGDTVTLEIIRDNARIELPVELGKRPSSETLLTRD